MNVTSPAKPRRNAKVTGISFQPHIWERLEREVERQGHRNRSLVIERALSLYFDIQDQRERGETVIVLGERVA